MLASQNFVIFLTTNPFIDYHAIFRRKVAEIVVQLNVVTLDDFYVLINFNSFSVGKVLGYLYSSTVLEYFI